MIDFDNIDGWAPDLTVVLSSCVPTSALKELAKAKPKYIEDARDHLFSLTERDDIIDATLSWMRSSKVAGYHGSRLTNEELASVRTNGLFPLKAEARRCRLLRALSPHPKWSEVEGCFETEIHAHGKGNAAGSRENQVHLTLSRSGLLNGFNHYLKYGSEFDQNVASALLGEDGNEFLARDGESRIVKVAVPGEKALDAAHRYFTIEDLRGRGEVPNLVGSFLEVWSYRQAHPDFQPRTLTLDCGMVFRSIVPAAWIISCETVVVDVT